MKIPFTFGHLLGDTGMHGRYKCPVCNASDALSVNMADPLDIRFNCVQGCNHVAILAALGQDETATVCMQGAEAVNTEAISDAYIAGYGCRTFDGFIAQVKHQNGGTIPEYMGDGVKIDELAQLVGYTITADRKNAYKTPVFSTSADLLSKDLPAPIFVVEGLLPVGLCIFAAPSKIGKSWLAIDLCNAVATGQPFWGRTTTQGSALYLCLEGGEHSLKQRMHVLGCKKTPYFQYALSVPAIGRGFEEAMESWMASCENPRLIVIDVLQRAKPVGSARKTAYDNDYDIMAPLNAFAVQHQIAVIAITHNRKANGLAVDDYESITGSIAQMGAAQTAWLIKGKRGPDPKVFMATGREIRDVEDVIVFDDQSCRWVNQGDSESAAEALERASFEKNPVRATLHKLLYADESRTWSGAFKDLWEEVVEHTGQYPCGTVKELGLQIRRLYPLLAERDGIYHKRDHKRGTHTFYMKSPLIG